MTDWSDRQSISSVNKMSSSNPGPLNSSSRPSIRLTLSSSASATSASSSVGGTLAGTNAASSSTSAPHQAAPEPKRRKYTPVNLSADYASVSQLTVLHQQTTLHFVLDQPIAKEPTWHAQGKTTLYVIRNDCEAHEISDDAASSSTTMALALHLRSTCQVRSVQVGCLQQQQQQQGQESNTFTGISNLRTSYHHADPLKYVLLKPAASYSVAEDANASNADDTSKHRFHADSQSSRGAVGMTTALRAASIASNMGELRISCERPSENTLKDDQAAHVWKQVIVDDHKTSGVITQAMQQQLRRRSTDRRSARLELISERLAHAGLRALRITVSYTIPLDNPSGVHHLGGLHVLSVYPNPHVYTTTGTHGDHEGPRCWMPCADSAAVNHRYSHEITVQVTAPMDNGLSVVGAGEDFGCAKAMLLHKVDWDRQRATEQLGGDHVDMLERLWRDSNNQHATFSDRNSNVHVIPSEFSVESLALIQATVLWTSASWSPAPARSIGFAIGPFKILEDPEYFSFESFTDSVEADGDDDNDDRSESLTQEQKHQVFVDAARDGGEGFRQVYFAPLHERKLVHYYTDRTLLPKTRIILASLTKDQTDITERFDATVTGSTTGVPHRALALMRDVLAVPSFRTIAYTQIWIPDAVHGGVTSGALHLCPEVMMNPFLGGAILDARLIPPVNARLPFHGGGRVLQFMQARSAIRGWLIAALPLGGHDDVGNGYILSTIESLLMSLYERGHGAYGEGGARGGNFYCKRYASSSGLNSPNLDFLPVQNIEDIDPVISGVGAAPVDERHNDQLWRSYTNGTESHTGALDEFNLRHLLVKDAVEALERGTDKDGSVPLPSMGWFGSHLSLSYLSSNATSSTNLGCGAVEMQHPIGGLVYRTLKADVLRGVVEGRAGVSNFIRLVRVAFIAAQLEDVGETELHLSLHRDKKSDKDSSTEGSQLVDRVQGTKAPAFVVCINEVLKKKGLSHNLFARALESLSGRHLLGSLVDIERHAEDPRTRGPFVDPEGFPNSYVRGSSQLYCRVGVYVEMKDSGLQAQAGSLIGKGIQMQSYAEPIIPEGGIAYGGPVTMRVVENEGQFREYLRDLDAKGSRRDWGAVTLHAKPVTSVKAQTAANGTIEAGTQKDAGHSEALAPVPSIDTSVPTKGFNDDNFHVGGYQAIELIRFTNITPLLWVRVDPGGVYGGRISVSQPDACLAECLYHDGDAAAQVDAMRALAERPLHLQSLSKVTSVFDVNVSELPVRVIGDCLRGSAAAHSSLPHTPAVRSQAALAIAQWQNNKAPKSKDDVGADNWVGLSLLFQYFRERFYGNGIIMPPKFSRLSVKKTPTEAQVAANAGDGGTAISKNDDGYQYLDLLLHEDRASVLDDSEDIDVEEDEEYRVRTQVIAAIASIRAGDGQTPPSAIRFVENILESDNGEFTGHLIYPEEEFLDAQLKIKEELSSSRVSSLDLRRSPAIPFVSSMLTADHLLSLCHINSFPNRIMDPTTGIPMVATGSHPVSNLMKISRSWLDWELYREKMRDDIESTTATGISGNCQSVVAPSAILALSSLALLRLSTSESSEATDWDMPSREAATVAFYIHIYDRASITQDVTRAACAQAAASLFCAADRLKTELSSAVGLLSALEFLLEKIQDDRTSPGLRETLALIMMDVSTGKVSSMQRVGVVGGRNDLVASTARLMTGPLGASHGGDRGSSMLTSVSPAMFPAASAVNDGARRGFRLLTRAGHPREMVTQDVIVRVAEFATRLWRTINGELTTLLGSKPHAMSVGVCSYSGALRCSLLALWQWLWPKGCFALLSVQAWGSQLRDVMQTTEEEKVEGAKEEVALDDINQLVTIMLDRQAWRGEMAKKAYDMYAATKGSSVKAEQGIGQPLPPIRKDEAFKQGGWIASAAQQRRKLALDGGRAVTTLRLTKKNTNDA